MSKSNNMLRTRRRDNNVKPNRRDTRQNLRLDRKSSRGMIYENEELRLKTININAEIERGQYDIKKLKRENELLKKEIWCLRDEYDKLEKIIKEKKIDFSSSSSSDSSSDTESCSSCSEDGEEVETSQNLENVQKTNLKNIHQDFDSLSVVPEEPSSENNSLPRDFDDCIKPDQSYPIYENLKKSQTLPLDRQSNFFSSIKPCKSFEQIPLSPGQFYCQTNGHYPATSQNSDNTLVLNGLEKSSSDLIVKIDNQDFDQINFSNTPSRSTFSNGGNLEDLLNDIESISQKQGQNILEEIHHPNMDNLVMENGTNDEQKPYKSELNVVLMPNAMPLIGFDKYRNIQKSFESLNNQPIEDLSASQQNLSLIPQDVDSNPFFFGNFKDNYVNTDYFSMRYIPENYDGKTAQEQLHSSGQVSSENEEILKFKTSQGKENTENVEKKSPKMSLTKKVSIHFKGKKDKTKSSSKTSQDFDAKLSDKSKSFHQQTPSIESRNKSSEIGNTVEPNTPNSSDSKTSVDKKLSNEKKDANEKISKEKDKDRKSISTSPDRKQKEGDHKKHKKHKKSDRTKGRNSLAVESRIYRDRSYSVCTDRSLDHRMNLGGSFIMYDDYSDRNTLSSCESLNPPRKMSTISNVPLNGKVPWCGCWGNGCL
ncbi:unnamed protein product [Brassicogethes aeneus]|uniref:Uncharacterized protein n=1 Tax=Brassicogethes aeneus TaxID=1431903 RepID=A0A9P0AX50_BRAAE|nr:unnamed protein product [Brassicogethes aeneus]